MIAGRKLRESALSKGYTFFLALRPMSGFIIQSRLAGRVIVGRKLRESALSGQ